jgi:hypothetical protein
MDFICKSCGENQGFSQEVEVSGTGYVDVDVELHDDLSVTARADSYVQNIEHDTFFDHANNYFCNSCEANQADIMDLIGPLHDPEAEVDPIQQAQKSPHKHQMQLTPEPEKIEKEMGWPGPRGFEKVHVQE